MGNMSHCRFRNTLEDLRECWRWMAGYADPFEPLGTEERAAAIRLVQLCREIGEDIMEPDK